MAKAENTSIANEIISELIQFPQVNIINGTVVFGCPSSDYSILKQYPTFLSQAGTFVSLAGLLFAIVVYGTTSAFGYIVTCYLDDFVILIIPLVVIYSWYTLAKPV